jgi:hypothetical protein
MANDELDLTTRSIPATDGIVSLKRERFPSQHLRMRPTLEMALLQMSFL